MKKKGQWPLLAAGVLGIVLSVVMWIVDLRLLLFVPAIPAFCFQLFACRATQRRWLRLIPFGCVLLFFLTGAGIWVVYDSWDELLGVIMVLASISPAVGCLLGAGTYLMSKKEA